MILVTTCRKPCVNTRRFARQLANLVPQSEYEPRGKKNVYDLIELAKKKGLRRICIASDYKGNPGKLEFLRVSGADWDWDSRVLRIKSVEFIPKAQVCSLKTAGSEANATSDLLDIDEIEDADTTLEASQDAIVFKNNEILMRITLKE